MQAFEVKDNAVFVGISEINYRTFITILMMKTKLLVMLGLLLALSNVMKAEAQLQKISVELEDVSVVTLIKELKRQTGLDFLYNIDEVTRNGNISVSAKDVTVEEILKESLPEKGLGFSIVNDVIIIKPLEKGVTDPKEDKVVIKGVVKDKSGVPLPGVTVMIAGTTVGVTTNANGEFSLVAPTGSNEVKLALSFVGMKAQTIVWKGQDLLNVVMEEDTYALDQVNVIYTGYQRIDSRRRTSAISSVRASDIFVPGMTSIEPSFGRTHSRIAIYS